MKTAITIAAKDLRQRLRDRSAIVVGIIAPLGLAWIFSFVFNPIADFEFTAEFAVANDDEGPVGQLFVDEVLGGLSEDLDVTVREVASRERALALVDVELDLFADRESADAAFVIPSGFSQAIASDATAEIEVIAGEGATFSSGLAIAVAEGFTSQMETARVGAATASQLGSEESLIALGQQALAVANPATLVDSEATSKILAGTTFYAAGLAIFFLFFTVQFGVNSLLEERHAGTLSRLLAAPIPRFAIIAGKAINAFMLGVVSMLVLIVATTLMFGAEWGDPIGVVLLVLAGIFAAIGIMAIVAGFAKTAEQAQLFSSIIAVVLGFLGGTFFPVAQSGGVLARLRFITPHAWFMQGLGDLAGGRVLDVAPAVLALVLFGLVASGLAIFGVRRGLQT